MRNKLFVIVATIAIVNKKMFCCCCCRCAVAVVVNIVKAVIVAEIFPFSWKTFTFRATTVSIVLLNNQAGDAFLRKFMGKARKIMETQAPATNRI